MTTISSAVALLALLLYGVGFYTLKAGIEPFMYDYYLFCWWSYILFLDAIIYVKRNRFMLLNRTLPCLITVSCAFWSLFELLNVRLANWFYVNIPIPLAIRYPGYLLAYGTVIPGIVLTREVLSEFIGAVPVRPIRAPRSYPAAAVASGLVMLTLALALPTLFFWLAWGFMLLILDGWNYRLGHRSFMGELQKGEAGNLLASLVAGLVCGLLWELWNWPAVSKWIYTVPYFDELKLFEMPLLGYVGFAFFSLETIAFVNLLRGRSLMERRPLPLAAAALAVSLLIFPVIDRATIFSFLEPIEKVALISPATRERLKAEGVWTTYGIKDEGILTPSEQASVGLLQLKGLGYRNALLLEKAGIKDVRGLAGLTPRKLGAIIGESNMRRTVLYIKAARDRIPHRSAAESAGSY